MTQCSIADQHAANGYFVIVPDILHGDPVPLNPGKDFDFMTGWLPNHGPETVEEPLAKVLAVLKSDPQYNIKTLGSIGICFGAKYVVRLLSEERQKTADIPVAAGFVAHPSFVSAEELKAITKPLSIAASETDAIFPKEKRRESEDILETLGVPYQMTLYSGVEHGFSVRADISKPVAKFAKEKAFLQSEFWFDEYLKV
jgi:dienelactone hydrolase